MKELLFQESFLDYPDRESHCVNFYMYGCNRNCHGCQNNTLKAWKNLGNKELIINEIKDYCDRSKTNKLCLEGGDPLYKYNIELTSYILNKLGNILDICIYTGADLEEVKKNNLKGFKFIKCGKYEEHLYIGSKKTNDFIQFATSNQQLYDKDLELISNNGIYYFK